MLNTDTTNTSNRCGAGQPLTRTERRRQTARHMGAVHQVSTSGRRDLRAAIEQLDREFTGAGLRPRGTPRHVQSSTRDCEPERAASSSIDRASLHRSICATREPCWAPRHQQRSGALPTGSVRDGCAACS